MDAYVAWLIEMPITNITLRKEMHCIFLHEFDTSMQDNIFCRFNLRT